MVRIDFSNLDSHRTAYGGSTGFHMHLFQAKGIGRHRSNKSLILRDVSVTMLAPLALYLSTGRNQSWAELRLDPARKPGEDAVSVASLSDLIAAETT